MWLFRWAEIEYEGFERVVRVSKAQDIEQGIAVISCTSSVEPVDFVM
jgi:hypothetical protein